MKQKVMNVLLGGALLLSAPLFTSCEDILGEWDRPTPASGGSGGSSTGGIEYVAYTVSGSTATAGTQTATTYTEVTSTTTTWAAGTYVVSSDVTINGNVTLSGDVQLILCDGKTLTVNGQIANPANSLSLYGQTESTGKLIINSTSNDAFPIFAKDLNVHGGQITTTATGTGTHGIEATNNFSLFNGRVVSTGTAAGIMTTAFKFYGGYVKAVGTGSNGIGYYVGGTVDYIFNYSGATINYATDDGSDSWSTSGSINDGDGYQNTTKGIEFPVTIA